MKNQNETEVTGNQVTKKEKSKLSRFILRHKMVFFLLLVIIGLGSWSFIKIKLMENKFSTEYENKLDSLTTKQMIMTTEVFSWAVRSELTRENKEQVNQFFTKLILNPSVLNIKFIDATNSKVSLSTDKKDLGMTLSNPEFQTDKIITSKSKNDSVISIISPVMGLNNKIGTLVIDYQLK